METLLGKQVEANVIGIVSGVRQNAKGIIVTIESSELPGFGNIDVPIRFVHEVEGKPTP